MNPETAHPEFQTVAIVGLGLIGGSLARQIRDQRPETILIGVDPNEASRQQALDDGVINTGLARLDALDLPGVDLVILGTHVTLNSRLLAELAARTTAPIRVMDLGSTKASICELGDNLPSHVDFIGGHPLAGREVSGYTHSRGDLFLNKRFLLCPCKTTSEGFQTRIQQWLTQLGSIPVLTDRVDHDRLMGLVSHFPQLYAVALANLLAKNNPDEAMHFLGGGIDDQMRLMASPHDMWGAIYQDNKTQVNAVLNDFIDILQGMQQALMNDELHRWFETSHHIYAQYQSNKS